MSSLSFSIFCSAVWKARRWVSYSSGRFRLSAFGRLCSQPRPLRRLPHPDAKSLLPLFDESQKFRSSGPLVKIKISEQGIEPELFVVREL